MHLAICGDILNDNPQGTKPNFKLTLKVPGSRAFNDYTLDFLTYEGR
jgi:hypothetical protein